MADEYPKLDVIAVGAHPDDVEIACGGTLASLVKQGYKVGIIDLTDGEPTPGSASPEERLAEAQAAAEVLGVEIRKTLDLPNRKLFDCYEARVALAIEFRKYRPQLVIGFGDKTPHASPDHWQAMQITDAGIFYSRLTKWDSEFENLPVHRIEGHLYYSLAFRSLESPLGESHFVSDISDTFDQKMESIACYKSQFPPEKAHVFDRLRAINQHHGQAAGFEAGEMLSSPVVLGTRDIMKTTFGSLA
jgi:bacillithiol biosynthesis deacetylase BshB1